MSALGISRIEVARKPRVAILSTGDELLDSKEKSIRGKTYDINRQVLSALVEEEGCKPIDLGIAPDDDDEIRTKLRMGLRESDAVIASGGTSVGEKDLLPKVVNTLGKHGLLIHGVAMRPGSPIALASIEGKPMLLTPGFSVSCIFGFYVFGRAMIRKILQRRLDNITTKAVITKDMERNELTSFVLVKLTYQGDYMRADPIRPSGSNILSSFVRANGYLILPRRASVKKGQLVNVIITRPFMANSKL
ncbi:MAG: molybdopterin molybdotransferase MoeA [Thaumarchaeota archaeon]|nr:molybdopterin molybdotransferase MoeA [Nitrososphaerota archaeon]